MGLKFSLEPHNTSIKYSKNNCLVTEICRLLLAFQGVHCMNFPKISMTFIKLLSLFGKIKNYINMLNNKNILVTGNRFFRDKRFVNNVLLKYKPKRLIIFSRGGSKQSLMTEKFSPKNINV